MRDLLGEHSEPDPLFFVETWTIGIESAAQSFHARHRVASHHDSDTSPFRSFDFSVPLVFIQEGSHDIDAFPSMPAGFSAAWKDAYGVSPSSSSSSSTEPRDELPFTAPIAGQPLTPDDARRILGVAATSTRKQIKTAYRHLVWRYHPDRLIHTSEQERRIATDRMTAINQAYRLLCADH